MQSIHNMTNSIWPYSLSIVIDSFYSQLQQNVLPETLRYSAWRLLDGDYPETSNSKPVALNFMI